MGISTAKTNRFFNGTKCKICFGNHRFSFPPKIGGLIFLPFSLKGGVPNKDLNNPKSSRFEMSDLMSDQMSDRMAERIADSMSDQMSDGMSDLMLDLMSDRM